MAKYIQNNFNGGILAKEMYGRTDQERYFSSVADMTNWIPTIFGNAKRRYGMRYYVPAMGPSRFIPFRLSTTNSYLIEFGDGALRFYDPSGQIQSSPGVPYQISAPWSATNNLWLIKFAQQNDVMYITHPLYPTMRLNHLSDLNWTITTPAFDAPPIDRFNTDISKGTITLTPGSTSGLGSVFTASAPVFIAGDVGKAIVIGQGRGFIQSIGGATSIDPDTGATLNTTATVNIVDPFILATAAAGTWFLFGSPQSYFSLGSVQTFMGNPQWTSSKKLGIHGNQSATAFAKYPEEGNGGGTGAAPPDKLDSFRTSDAGRWILSGGSCMKITAVNNASEIIVDLYTPITDVFVDSNGNQRAMPESGGLWTINDPVFTADNGYPAAVAFYQSRMWLGGNTARATSAYGSASGDYENFAPGSLDNQGMAFTEDSGQFDTIEWMAPFLGNLITGNLNSEWAIGPGGSFNQGSATTPSNINTLVQSLFGSCSIQAIQVENQLLYVQRSTTKVFEFSFSIYNVTLLSKDMQQFAAVLDPSGFKEMVYQQTPSTSDGLGRVIWFTCNDGLLYGLTYKKDNDVWGWHRQITGTPAPQDEGPDDMFISVGVMSSADGLTDDLWAVVSRGDAAGYTIEKFDATLNTDGATQTDLGSKFSSVSGLAYLAGKTVDVVGDGAYQGQQVVPSSGIIPLNPPAQNVEVGVHYDSTITSLFIEVKGGQNSQGYKKRFNKLWARIKGTLNLRINGQKVPFRTPSDSMGQAVPINLEVNDVEVKNLGFSRTLQWSVVQDQPFPAELLAVFGDLEIGEN